MPETKITPELLRRAGEAILFAGIPGEDRPDHPRSLFRAAADEIERLAKEMRGSASSLRHKPGAHGLADVINRLEEAANEACPVPGPPSPPFPRQGRYA